jgi:hypothetical protein
MGEKIKILTKINDFLDIELNKASVKGGPRYIHIQNEKVRFCLTENDFLQIALNIKKSSEMFKYNKGMKNKL